MPPAATGYPAAGKAEILPPAIRTLFAAQPGYPTCLAALQVHVPVGGHEWPTLLIYRCGHYYHLTPIQFRALWEQGGLWQGERTAFSLAVLGCKCKAKTALVTNMIPTPAHIVTLEDSKFGLTSLVPETVQLGLVVYGKVQPRTDLDLQPAECPPDFFQRTTYAALLGMLCPIRGGFGRIFRKANDAAVHLLSTLKFTYCLYSSYCYSQFTYVASSPHRKRIVHVDQLRYIQTPA